jgi:hypothetical protein
MLFFLFLVILVCPGTANAQAVEQRHLRHIIDRPVLTSTDDAIADDRIDSDVAAMSQPSLHSSIVDDEDGDGDEEEDDTQDAAEGAVVGFTTTPAAMHVHEEVESGAGGADDGAGGNVIEEQRQRQLQLPLQQQRWLTAHNRRRRHYHSSFGVTYVRLRWSASLAASAQSYAETLARTGRFEHSRLGVGENLAWNGGTVAPSPDSVLTRWADDEASSMGGHFTQVVWRATRYVGCGEAVRSGGGGHVQVCHYVTPGNCNGSTRTNMLATTSPCAPQCPAEGCF